MPTNVRQWDFKFRAAAHELPERLLSEWVRKIVLLILGAAVMLPNGTAGNVQGVIRLTPVDTGSLRLGWTVQVGAPDLNPPKGGAPLSPSKITAALRAYKPFDVVYVVNARPYAPVVEEGGYPDPVKRGSWDRKRKRFVIKSAGGFSKQARRGMLLVTIMGVRQVIG